MEIWGRYGKRLLHDLGTISAQSRVDLGPISAA